VDDLYGGGVTGNLLRSYANGDPRVYAWLQNRHSRGCGIIRSRIKGGVYTNEEHVWKVPLGVRQALTQPLGHSQIVNRYPWYVTWRSPRTGKRHKKFFNTLYQAIAFTAEKAQYVDPHSTIVCRHGMLIPYSLVGRLPRPWRWCPCCMKPRKFYRVRPEQTFSAIVRTPDDWREGERTLVVIHCRVCGITNRDHLYLKSNLWLVRRRVKKGVRRVKSMETYAATRKKRRRR
jgi:hypothetical protein